MKKIVYTLLAALLCLMLAMPAAMASTAITANGSGEVMVTADTAVITLGVNRRAVDVLTAQADVNSTIANIRAALASAGVPEEDINTGSISVYAIYDYSGDVEQLTAYSVSSLLAVRTTDMANIGMLIDSAFEAGANTLSDISFSASDTSDADSEALKAAVADALAKADTMAAAAGLKITGITAMQEGSSFSFDSGVNNFAYAAKDRAEAATFVQAAKLCVRA